MSRSIKPYSYASTFAWSLDFWRAFLERPKVFRWITRLAMGQYAYRELYGIKESIEKSGSSLDMSFISCGLQGMDYHKDKVKT